MPRRDTAMLRAMLGLGSILAPSVVVAQAPPPPPPQSPIQPPPQPIVVTGAGLPTSAAAPAFGSQVIERPQIVASASGRIEDVLAGIAGFQQFRRSDSRSANPSAQGATLRALGGNATSRTLVLLDGVPVADPFFGFIPFNALAPDRLSSIRVTRGGGWGGFGAGAVAGTIELTSAGRDELDPFAASALIDQRGSSELSASIAPRLGRGFAVVSGRWDRGPGFWTTPRDQRVAASARARYENWSAGLRGVAPLAPKVELQARALVFDDRRTLRFRDADSTTSGQDASLRVVGRGRWQFDALGYVQARDFSNVVVSATSFRLVLDQRKTPSTGLGGKIELRPPVGGGLDLRLGGDARIADGELLEEPISGMTGQVTARRRAGGRTEDLGLFAAGDWRLGRLVLSAGARADRWSIRDGFFRETAPAGTVTVDDRFADRSGWSPSFRGGAVFAASGTLTLRGSAYRGLRLPTLNELYRPFVVFPVTTRANAALRNERLRGFEAGVDLAPGRWASLSLTAFDNRVRDAIANVTLAPDLRQRRNVDAVHARGLELAGEARRGRVSFAAAASLTDAVVEASGVAAALDGRRPAQTPRFAASATLAWRPDPLTALAMNLRHTGRQFEDDLETDVLPAVTTLDAFVRLPLTPRLGLVLRGENLADERIVTRNQGGSIDLGTPRTLWAGLRWGGL